MTQTMTHKTSRRVVTFDTRGFASGNFTLNAEQIAELEADLNPDLHMEDVSDDDPEPPPPVEPPPTPEVAPPPAVATPS